MVYWKKSPSAAAVAALPTVPVVKPLAEFSSRFGGAYSAALIVGCHGPAHGLSITLCQARSLRPYPTARQSATA